MTFSRRGALALVGGLASLAACGSSDKSSQGATTDGAGKTLSVFFSANPQNPQEQKIWFQQMSDDFKKGTGATVQFETYNNSSDAVTRLQTSVVSGRGPDVFGLNTTLTPTAYATGGFVKLGAKEWAAIGGREKFGTPSLGLSGPNDANQVGVPFSTRPYVLAYNKDLLKAAGIASPAQTWDELADQAKQLTKDGTFGLAVAYKDPLDPWKFIWAMSNQAGNPLLKDGQATLDDPAVNKAYETYFGWLTKGHAVDPASVGWANPQAVAAFAAGKAAYLPLATNALRPTLDKSSVAGKYGFALMPTVPPGATQRPAGGVEAASILSGQNLVLADYSQNKALALTFVKMITDEKVQSDYFKSFGEIPNNLAAAKAMSQDDPLVRVSVEAQNKMSPTPFSGAWADVQASLANVVVQSIPDLNSGGVTADNLKSRLAAAQKTAQDAASRAK